MLYGIDIVLNGYIWYGKLNGQCIGCIIFEFDDDDLKKVMEWQLLVYGLCCMYVVLNGFVWVLGWVSGDIVLFDLVIEEWVVYQLLKGLNLLFYVFNIEFEMGYVWVCGMGIDLLLCFDFESKMFIEYNLLIRVIYMCEFEFDDEGYVWIVNLNWLMCYIENGMGLVIWLLLLYIELMFLMLVFEIVVSGGCQVF